MKNVLFAIIVLTLNATYATTVEWDKMTAVDTQVWDTGHLWNVWGYSENNAWLEVAIVVTYGQHGDLAGSRWLSGQTTLWSRQMSYGEIASYDSLIGQGGSYFYRSTKGTPDIQCDYDMIFGEDGTGYLGFAAIAYTESSGYTDEYLAYGWVQLALDPLSNPVVVASAWDVDGGAMIVGGGAVPEPTSGLLFLLGISVLVLKRRV